MISGAMVVSSILARMVSASLNYSLNRKFVFKSQEAAIESLPKYITLALCILLGNVILLRGIVSFGINAYLAKIITEIMMFVISWSVQRQFVFKKGTREGDLYEKA
jgi:glycosyltransferase, group 2 family protein